MLRAYEDGDLDLHARLLGDPETMAHLGGPETREQIERRHARLVSLSDPEDGRMFVIETDGSAVGTIGHWPRHWRGDEVWETGWMILSEYRGRGLAGRAVRDLVARLRGDSPRRFLHAFPATDNLASNALCAATGFTLVEETSFEYPKGHWMRCNDWRLDLWN